MERTLTLLLALLVALAPLAPAEAGEWHAQATDPVGIPDGSIPFGGAHAHENRPSTPAGDGSRATGCSLVVSHCVVALPSLPGRVFPAEQTVAARLSLHPEESAKGVILTSEPPPPRA